MSLLLAAAMLASPISLPREFEFKRPFIPIIAAENVRVRGVTMDTAQTPVEYETITCRADPKGIMSLGSDGIFDFTFTPSNILAPEGGLQEGHCAYQDRPMSAETIVGIARINLYMSGTQTWSAIYTPQSTIPSQRRVKFRFDQTPSWLLKFTTTTSMVTFRVYKDKVQNILIGYHQ